MSQAYSARHPKSSGVLRSQSGQSKSERSHKATILPSSGHADSYQGFVRQLIDVPGFDMADSAGLQVIP